MPIMDGIALALSAARDFPRLTILLMTGFADQRERASNLNAIAHDVITKPSRWPISAPRSPTRWRRGSRSSGRKRRLGRAGAAGGWQ